MLVDETPPKRGFRYWNFPLMCARDVRSARKPWKLGYNLNLSSKNNENDANGVRNFDLAENMVFWLRWAEKSRGEGITGRERGVRYWNVHISWGARGPLGLKSAEKLKTPKKLQQLSGFSMWPTICFGFAPIGLEIWEQAFLDLEIQKTCSVRPNSFQTFLFSFFF